MLTRIFLLLVLCLLQYYLWFVNDNWLRATQLYEENAQLTDKRTGLEGQVAEIQEQIKTLLETDVWVENRAREELGFLGHDETLYLTE